MRAAGRSAFWMLIVLVLAAGSFAPWSRRAESGTEIPAGSEIRSGILDCPVANGAVDVRLPRLPRGHRYRLIVSSLADAGPTWNVSLSCSPLSDEDPALPLPTPWPELAAFQRPASRVDCKSPGVAAARRTSTPNGDFGLPDADGDHAYWLHVTDGSLDDSAQYTQIKTSTFGHKGRIVLDVDRQCPHTTEFQRRCAEVLSVADELLPEIEQQLGRGPQSSVSIRLVLTPWLSRLQGGQTRVGGFVRSGDFRPLPEPFSNGAAIVYLNSDLPEAPSLRALLAHEMTHAVAIDRRRDVASPQSPWSDEEDWLSEGLAHLVETTSGALSNLDHRVARFQNDPSGYPLVVDDYYRAGLWRNHGCRGATWSFLEWGRRRLGPTFVPQLANTTRRGRENVESASGIPFAELFRAWTLDCVDSPHASEGVAGDFKFGRFPQSGVRCDVWNVEQKSTREATVAGTAAAYWELDADFDRNPMRLQIMASPSARLQVTLKRIPPEHAQWNVFPRWVGSDGLSGTADSPLTSECVELHFPKGPQATGELDRATLVRFRQTTVELIEFDTAILRTAGERRAPSSSTSEVKAAANGRSALLPVALGRRKTIPLDRAANPEPEQPWRLHLVVRKAGGCRFVGQATLPDGM